MAPSNQDFAGKSRFSVVFHQMLQNIDGEECPTTRATHL